MWSINKNLEFWYLWKMEMGLQIFKDQSSKIMRWYKGLLHQFYDSKLNMCDGGCVQCETLGTHQIDEVCVQILMTITLFWCT